MSLTKSSLISLIKEGKYSIALAYITQMLCIQSNLSDPLIFNLQGVCYRYLGSFEKALEAFGQASRLNPNSDSFLNNIGLTLIDLSRFEPAIETLTKALRINPNNQHAIENLVIANSKFGNHELALKLLEGNDLDIYKKKLLRASVLFAAGSLDSARTAYEEILANNPQNIEVLTNLALIENTARNQLMSLRYIKNAIKLAPESASVLLAHAQIILEQEGPESAIQLLVKLSEKLNSNSEYLNIFGLAYLRIGDLENAREKFRLSIQKSPTPTTLINYSITQRKLGNVSSSVKTLLEVLSRRPNHPEAVAQLAQHFLEEKEPLKASQILKSAIQQYKSNDFLMSLYFICLRRLADTDNLVEVEALASEIGLRGQSIVPPLVMISAEDNPKNQLIRSRRFATKFCYSNSAKPNRRSNRRRINLAYVSADFYDFPGMHLMQGLFRSYDRQKFNVIALSFSNRHDRITDKVKTQVDKFIDIRSLDDNKCLELINNLNLDIAINRNGYTKNERTSLFAKRIAPVQINYLGFPSTTGAEFIDWIVADPIVIPNTHSHYYSEGILRMPHCYQPNDNKRPVPAYRTGSKPRELPPDSFVFANFNRTEKNGLDEYHAWSSILRENTKSVLWLLEENAVTQKNLRNFFEDKGVNPNRIVFGGKMDRSRHMERLCYADLVLDSFYYNGHTTSSDAIWSGVPVVTKLGEQFAARVSSSILMASDLDQLISHSTDEYILLASKLASDPKQLRYLSDKIRDSRYSSKLFDTQKYVNDFESLLESTI